MNVKEMLNDINANVEKSEENFLNEMLYNSRQNEIGELSPWMFKILNANAGQTVKISYAIEDLFYDQIIENAIDFLRKNNKRDIVIGISGGSNSSITLAFLCEIKKRYGINIHPYFISIGSDGNLYNAKDICNHFDLHLNIVNMDYSFICIKDCNAGESLIREKNLKSRMRMMYLYDKAHENNGLVVGTGDFSEYVAGFRTLHGDVGDFSPLEGLYKSTEIPMMAKHLNLPEKYWRIAHSNDEEILGMSYLEWDILSSLYIVSTSINSIVMQNTHGYKYEDICTMYDDEFIKKALNISLDDTKPNKEDKKKVELFLMRVKENDFKRLGPVALDCPVTRKIELMQLSDDLTQASSYIKK